MHTDDDSLWSKVKRKLQPALAAVDQLIEARERAAGRRHVISDLHARQHGTRDAQPWSLRPSELATARRIGSLAPHERSGDDKAALLGLLRERDREQCGDGRARRPHARLQRRRERRAAPAQQHRRRPRAAKPAGRVSLAAGSGGGRCGGGAVLKLPLPVQ